MIPGFAAAQAQYDNATPPDTPIGPCWHCPDGYDVVTVDVDDEIPADVLARNKAWKETTDA